MWRTVGLGGYRNAQGMSSSFVLQSPGPSPGHQECHLPSSWRRQVEGGRAPQGQTTGAICPISGQHQRQGSSSMTSMSSSDLHKGRNYYPKFREDMESHSFIHSSSGFIDQLSHISYMRLPRRHCRLSPFRFPVSISSSPLTRDESWDRRLAVVTQRQRSCSKWCLSIR